MFELQYGYGHAASKTRDRAHTSVLCNLQFGVSLSNFVAVIQYCSTWCGVASRVILYLIYSYNDGITDYQRLSLIYTLYARSIRLIYFLMKMNSRC